MNTSSISEEEEKKGCRYSACIEQCLYIYFLKALLVVHSGWFFGPGITASSLKWIVLDTQYLLRKKSTLPVWNISLTKKKYFTFFLTRPSITSGVQGHASVWFVVTQVKFHHCKWASLWVTLPDAEIHSRLEDSFSFILDPCGCCKSSIILLYLPQWG